MKKGFVLKSKRWVMSFFFVLFLVPLFFFSFFTQTVFAQFIMTDDELTRKAQNYGNTQGKAKWSWEKTWEELKAQLEKAGSKAYHSALSSALKTIAYDTATWIGSGGEGQEPLFIREGWGEYLTNVADNAAGTFIEDIMKGGGFEDFNLCEPSAGVKINISLGLKQYAKPDAPDCTFSEMRENWSEALTSPNFLNDVQNMFDPTSNDIGITFNAYVKMIGKIESDKNNETLFREEGGGWLDVRNIGGLLESVPGEADLESDLATKSFWENIGPSTGSAFVDAINVFLNQLAITLFQNLMRNLAGDSSTYTSSYDWSSFDSDSYSGGAQGMEDHLGAIENPNFDIRGDYDILAELTICPDPTNAGPTNCVIEDKFRQAIQEKITVAEAIESGYLNENGTFGFLSDSLEPEYTEAYPYRSMIILRKFRILPVGWELAAQYLKDNMGVVGSKNLGEMVACFDPSDEYTGYNDFGAETWCLGLVDPNWVLKAPLNYCRREGYGSYVLYETVTGEDDDSETLISRSDDYCADEQSCIKELDDGSCEAYGYCVEEKRKWNFGSDSCDPIYNTCQTFTDQENGQTHSFLENTLNYCDNPGCIAYCPEYDYLNDEYCADSDDRNLYLLNAEECDEDDEGCHEFIRVLDESGANLLYNSSYEEAIDPIFLAVSPGVLEQVCNNNTIGAVYGSCVSRLMDNTPSIPITLFDGFNYDFEGKLFTFSFYAKGCGDGVDIGIGGDSSWLTNYSTSTINTTNDWQRFSVTHVFDGGTELYVKISENPANPFPAVGCYIDAMMVEKGGLVSAYSEYRQSGLLHEKKLPDYLKDICYESIIPTSANFNEYKDDAPSVCFDYARECNENEVDCELYRSTTNNITYPAKVTINDYCPEECVGYSEYLRSNSAFDSQSVAFLIPDKGKKCNISANGCTEFTNLDKLGDGAENIEYYSQLKHCTSTSDIIPNTNCSDYYTWEGSSESGFQLRVHKLKKDGGTGGPEVVEDDTNECDVNIFNLPSTDPSYNFDCREFYDATGEVTYHLYSRIVTCSDDCHPYRRTDYNIVKNYLGLDITSAECLDETNVEYYDVNATASQINYNGTTGQCIYCKAGGVWNSEHGACIYNAIPDDGVKCNAGQSGCREYSGSTGNDMEILVNDDFSTNVWTSSNTINPSVSSYIASADPALECSSSGNCKIETTISSMIETGKSYYLSFVAIPSAIGGLAAKNIISVGLDNGNSFEEFTNEGSTIMSVDWKKYEFNISKLSHVASSSEIISIQMDGGFIIDNVKLIKTTERYYLIKDSWNTPDVCYDNIFGNPVGERYNLGCDEYIDRSDNYHYLRQFTSSCQESAVGCELMIDTHNYSNTNSDIWNDSNGDFLCDTSDGDECVAVEADNLTYMVYNENMLCAESKKGCQLFGEVYAYDNGVSFTNLYEDVYRINNPDLYDSMLCSKDDQDCKSWLIEGGSVSFIDPKDKYCVIDSGEWVQKQVSRCDDGTGTGLVDGNIEKSITAPITPEEYNVCLDSNDCGVIASGATCESDDDCGISADGGSYSCVEGLCHYRCLFDDTNYPCPVDRDFSQIKTFGTGGYEVLQPTSNWVGVCSASDSGCTEFIDPMSTFNTNIILNSTFKVDAISPTVTPNWSNSSQNVTLEKNTMYTFSVEGGSGSGIVTISSPSGDYFRQLDQDNTLLSGVSFLTLTFGAGRKSIIFYNDSLDESILASVYTTSMNDDGREVFLKETVIGYQFSQDIEVCSSNVDFEAGCVLFNKRNIMPNSTGIDYEDLIYDADVYEVSPGPLTSCSGETCDSSDVYKVTPDRVCNEWLACRSFIKDEDDNNICFEVGLCNRFDEMNNCSHFVSSDKENQTYSNHLSTPMASNMSGYTKVGYQDNSIVSDYFPIAAMEQKGGVAKAGSSGTFEVQGSNNYPIGWTASNNESWTSDRFVTIDNPIDAQNEGISYPVEGKAFLKHAPSLGRADSEFIDVEPGAEYILSAKINTMNFSTGSGFDSIQAGILVETYGPDEIISTFDASSNWDFVVPDENQTCGNDSPNMNGCAIYVTEGKDWHTATLRFTVGSNTTKIKLNLGGSVWYGGGFTSGPDPGDDYACHPSGACETEPGDTITTDCYGAGVAPYLATIEMSGDACTGNVYYDDIKLMPVLEARNVEISGVLYNNFSKEATRHIVQECRLYPSDDSMSCEYSEDSGIRKKGWYGYCMEFDRSPGSADTCLMWYPVDNVKGSGIEEGAGYLDRYPIYYTVDATTQRIYEYRHAYIAQEDGYEGCGVSNCPNNYVSTEYYCIEVSGGWFGTGIDRSWCVCEPDPSLANTAKILDGSQDSYSRQDKNCSGVEGYLITYPVSQYDGWYKYDEQIQSYTEAALITASGTDPLTGNIISNPYATYLCGGGATSCNISNELFRARAYATEIVQTVTPIAKNKYWRGRIFSESNHVIYGDTANPIEYSSDYFPFGSLIPPGWDDYSIVSNPYEWDSDDDMDEKQPLYYEYPDEDLEEPYQARAGQIYKCTPNEADDCKYLVSTVDMAHFPYDSIDLTSRIGAQSPDVIQHIFAQSYGTWLWTGTSEDGEYKLDETTPGSGWKSPTEVCPTVSAIITRPAYDESNLDNSYCGIPPKVDNISIDGVSSGNATLDNNGFINLTFTSEVDVMQLPLVMYSVDWGDGDTMTVSGVEMRDRSSIDDPHSMYHVYDYWTLKGKENLLTSITCGDSTNAYCSSGSSNCCWVTPTIKIKDNWDWCNNGVSDDICPSNASDSAPELVVFE